MKLRFKVIGFWGFIVYIGESCEFEECVFVFGDSGFGDNGIRLDGF